MSTDFLVIPAVDVKEGKCVRLYKGDPSKEKIFDQDPLNAARGWEKEGAKLLHVVDLDGAFSGKPKNFNLISSIIRELSIGVQVGGGIRGEEDVEAYVQAGAERVIVGTRAFEDRDWLARIVKRFGSRVAVGLDVKDERIATAGWKESIKEDPKQLLQNFARIGVELVILTFVSLDGTLKGVDFPRIEQMVANSPVPMIVSGGVSSLAQIERISRMKDRGICGVIVGMALYEGLFTLQEAMSVAR